VGGGEKPDKCRAGCVGHCENDEGSMGDKQKNERQDRDSGEQIKTEGINISIRQGVQVVRRTCRGEATPGIDAMKDSQRCTAGELLGGKIQTGTKKRRLDHQSEKQGARWHKGQSCVSGTKTTRKGDLCTRNQVKGSTKPRKRGSRQSTNPTGASTCKTFFKRKDNLSMSRRTKTWQDRTGLTRGCTQN